MRAAQMKERPNFTLMKQDDVQNLYYMQMPRWLFSDPRYAEMSLDAKVTYTFLLNRFQLSRRKGWVNERGEVFVIFPRQSLAKELRICEKRVTAAFRKLVELELVWEKRCGRGDANQIYLAKVNPQYDPGYTCAPFLPEEPERDGSRTADLEVLASGGTDAAMDEVPPETFSTVPTPEMCPAPDSGHAPETKEDYAKKGENQQAEKSWTAPVALEDVPPEIQTPDLDFPDIQWPSHPGVTRPFPFPEGRDSTGYGVAMPDQEPQNWRLQNRGFGGCRTVKSAVAEPSNRRSSKKDISKKDGSEKEVSQSVGAARTGFGPGQTTGTDDEEADLREILDSCELETFEPDTAMVFESAIERLYYSESLRIGNAVLPKARVRSRLWLLDGMVLREAESKLASNLDRKVRNSTAYTMVTIFNCITERESDLMVDPYLNSLRRLGGEARGCC